MSRSDDIRAALQQSGEPMFPREIADAMGAEDRRERSSIAAQVSEMANQRQGVEKMDDGRYSLVPGWAKGRRSEGAVAPKPSKAAAPPVPDGEPDQVIAARLKIEEGRAELTEAEYKARLPAREVVEVPPAGTATGTAASSNQVAERILEYLRGEADYNLLQLLRDAREEIMQLDCAARMALASAEQLTEQLRAATR